MHSAKTRPIKLVRGSALCAADSLGFLVLIVAVLGLHLLDERDVLLLGLLGGDILVNNLLPCVLLRLALYGEIFVLAVCALQRGLAFSKHEISYLQVKHARRRGLGDVLAGGDLEET